MENKISIIITHYTGDLVYRCLSSITHLGEQVILASSQRRKDTGVTNLYFARNEPTFKRNYATYYATGNYLCFLDDDVEVDANCIYVMRAYLKSNPDVGMVYATLYHMADPEVVDTAGSWLSWTGFLVESYVVPDRPVCVLSAKSACCMVRKDVFDEVGGFDEDFVIYGEETDLSWRIWHAGWKVKLLPDAIAYHAFGGEKDASYYNKRYIHFHGCKNYCTLLIKNLQGRNLGIALLNATIWLVVSLGFAFKNPHVTKWILQGLWYNIHNFPHIWRKRMSYPKTVSEDKFFYKAGLSYYTGRLKDYLTNQLHRKVE